MRTRDLHRCARPNSATHAQVILFWALMHTGSHYVNYYRLSTVKDTALLKVCRGAGDRPTARARAPH